MKKYTIYKQVGKPLVTIENLILSKALITSR